jgi:acetyl/propionyl-CoA carboxylase alpha subunit
MFAPQPGRLARVVWPAPAVDLRIETGVAEGLDVTPFYDPLLAKVVAHAPTRSEAIARLDRALSETTIDLVGPAGPAATNLEFLRRILAAPPFAEGRYNTAFAEALAKQK